MNQINIEIAYALPERYYLKSFQVDEGITVQTAITQSGILSQFPDIDLSTNKIGIFSRPIKLTDVLKEGDRIEIYLIANDDDHILAPGIHHTHHNVYQQSHLSARKTP